MNTSLGDPLVLASLLLYAGLFLELHENKEKNWRGVVHNTLCAAAMLVPCWLVITSLGLL